MKKIGIVGGIAWPSTVDYYSGLCRRSEEWHRARNLPGTPFTPEMSIESLDLKKVFSYFGNDDDEASWAQFDDYHRTALKRLEASGAEFAIVASNTPHHRFAAIVRGVGIPVLSILDAVANESVRVGAREVLILGTAVTMRSVRFREAFAKVGIKARGPDDDTTQAITVEMISDLQRGRVEGAAERMASMVRTSFGEQLTGQPVVCLACTELPLAFPQQKTLPTFEYDGVLYVNTTAVHINAAFDFAVKGE
jgi:aspartate racemase